MTTSVLQVEPRTIIGRGLTELRNQGYVPAVLYGQGSEAQALQVNARDLDRMLAHGGAYSLVSLSIEGVKEPQMALVREVQRYPTRPAVVHVDFYSVVMTDMLEADVPVVIVGESPAVLNDEAAIVQNVDSVQVQCLPGNLPSSFELDISVLERSDQNILLSDIVVPAGVEILDHLETVAISLAAARAPVEEEEEDEYGLEAPEAEEIEVVAKGKAASGIGEEGESGAT